MTECPSRVPVVEYLALEPEPHLRVRECSGCGARFFDRRSACAACGASTLATVSLGVSGTLKTFTIVAVGPPGVPTPYVAAIVDCDGTDVRTNLVHVEPDPAHLRPGMALRLCTVSLGRDADGMEAVGYAFEPDPEGADPVC